MKKVRIKVRLKYTITIIVMVIASVFVWFSKISDAVWKDVILGCLIAILIGFSVKTVLEIIKAWKGHGG